MSDKDYIKDLFSEKLGNYEAKVDPSLWNSIASQVAANTATTVSTGLSITAKWIIGVGVASVLTVATVLVLNNDNPTEKPQVAADKTASTVEETQNTDNNNSTIKGETITTEDAIDQEIAVISPTAEKKIEVKDTEEGGTTPTIIPPIEKKTPKIITEEKNTTAKIVTQPKEEEKAADSKEKEITNNQTEQEQLYKIGGLTNIFTPNNDGANDFLFIESSGLEDFSVVVLDINGKTVYQSKDPNFKWDGTNLGGEPVPVGRYVYYITARDSKGTPVNKYSQLTINR